MKITKKITLLIVVALLLSGCGIEDTDGSSMRHSHFLVNSTSSTLHYKAQEVYQDTVYRFDTIITSNDTLLLYWESFEVPTGLFYNPTGFMFRSTRVAIVNNVGELLFLRGECGKEGFVQVEIDKNNVNYYWTIDEAYIAEQSCGMTWEEFREWYPEEWQD